MTGLSARSVHGPDQELVEAAARAAEYLEGWKRARADYENLARRAADERIQARTEGAHAALLSLMTVIDHFDTALASVPPEIADHSWTQGIRHIYTAFTQALVAEGIEMIDAGNVVFDPALHEAVEQVASDAPVGTVVSVVARGYKIGTTVLRPAKVRVSLGQGETVPTAKT